MTFNFLVVDSFSHLIVKKLLLQISVPVQIEIRMGLLKILPLGIAGLTKTSLEAIYLKEYKGPFTLYKQVNWGGVQEDIINEKKTILYHLTLKF